MLATVGHLENIQKVPGTDHLEHMDFVCPQYTTHIVTGVHYKEGERGFHIKPGQIVPDELADEMELLGRLSGNKKNRVKARTMQGVHSDGIFYGQIGKHFNPEWPDGMKLYWGTNIDGLLFVHTDQDWRTVFHPNGSKHHLVSLSE